MPPAPRQARGALVRGLGLLGAVALVVGNMVGTSIYTLPAALAKTTGPLGIVAWVVTAAGYLLVALIYARLGTRYPRSGGPYVYAREAFGDFAGFQTVWVYWVGTLIGNAAIVTGAIGYAAGFSPTLAASPLLEFCLAQGVLWLLCAVNVLGVKNGARVQITIMFLNIGPLLLLAVAALFAFDARNLHPFAPHGTGSLAAGAALVVWAYSGVESATVPAEEVQAPERTIRRGTMLGYLVGTVVFLLTAVAIAGALPNDVIASSPRPMALLATRVAGGWAGTAIGLVAILAAIGTLNGWILMVGRIPLSAAADGIFFRALARIHPRFGTPATALVAGTLVTSLLLLLYFQRSLLGVFEFVALLGVLTTLLPHLYAVAAEWLIARRDRARHDAAERRRRQWIAALAFLFVGWTIYGVGAEVVLWGFLVVLAGIPLYIVFVTRVVTRESA